MASQLGGHRYPRDLGDGYRFPGLSAKKSQETTAYCTAMRDLVPQRTACAGDFGRAVPPARFEEFGRVQLV